MSEIKNKPMSFNSLDQTDSNESPSSGCHDNAELSCMDQVNLNEKAIVSPISIYACKMSQVKGEEPLMIVQGKNLKYTKNLTIKKRTPTSYDSETSFYLNSMFFQAYSTQKKLTKSQRLEVQKKTGLDSRKLTYWFSNHKRRCQEALKIYHDTIRRSGGRVSNYEEFVMWRRARGLPDRIGCAEIAAFKERKDQQKVDNH